ncbi:HXXXD-type acyl-transferase family protein [Artemisia annua]|uniref:HXXXD-type acyl-transferase family protein n=1 Tax=Artemisia annua TaxID=35608 RepID=A0A2U1PGW7_ARTAN|nr:HXXXD-type acyl-transferase family protein [Artemisia annua]
MEFSVTKSNGSLVQPSKPTPSTTLDLSRIDRLPVLRCNARTLHVFEAIGPLGVAQSTIREALSKALVPYYPLAGRLTSNGSNIDCTGDGVWFVEATANCSLKSVGYFEDVTSIPFNELLPPHPHETLGVDPLVLMQVTEFEGDGFVMGLTFCHTICDGLGAAQFLNAISEFARGIDPLTITPVWQRDFIPQPQLTSPSNLQLPPNFVFPDYNLVQTNIDIPLHHITDLKNKFIEENKVVHCSSFEIVAAILWKNRTHAIGLGPESRTMKLVFFANCRPLVEPPLPKGFYGNCFFPVTITTSSDILTQASLDEVVKMIQEAKARLPEEFAHWVNVNELNGLKTEDPFAPPLGYDTLFVSEWGRLGFNQVDYGNGPPVHVVPMQGSAIIPVAIVGMLPRPNKGVRLMTWCVQKDHLEPFLESIATIAQ